MKKLQHILWCAWVGSAISLSSAWAGAPVIEVGPMVGITKQIEQQEYENLNTNRQRQLRLKEIDKINIEKRKTALKMVEFQKLIAHMKVLYVPTPPNSTLAINNKASNDLKNQGEGEYKDYVMKTIDFIREMDAKDMFRGELVDPNAKIRIAVWDPPIWLNQKKASVQGGLNDLVLKVSARVQTALKRRPSEALEDMVYEAARMLFPREMMAEFNANATLNYLLAKAGVVELADGIVTRPAAPQDAAFARYANLNSDDTNRVLFWSDPMVVSGYHPVLGAALNRTYLRGTKQVDMDNIVSRGYSTAIDKWNRLQLPEKRIANPFRGYASRVIPGLIVMSDRGQLKRGEPPSDAQLEEAINLTQTLAMLPSQKMAKAASFQGDQIAQPLSNFKFIHPTTRAIRVQSSGGGGGSSTTVRLSKLEEKVFKNRMKLVQKRLQEIAKLKRENRLAREYAEEIIRSNFSMEAAARQIEQGMSLEGAIPQITQFRKDILASIEEYRRVLSELEHLHDKLLQKEWVILKHALKTKKEAVYQLMDNASVRLRSLQTSQET